ncbi:MAG: hypothetical protein LBK83_11260 [Treponema sp.]|jgi:hypothetical protein|nr:hypothetical protein [Treponema sp.]
MIMPGSPGMSSGLEENDLKRFLNEETERIRGVLDTMGYPGTDIIYEVHVRIDAKKDIHELRLPQDTVRFSKSFVPDVPDKTKTATPIPKGRKEAENARPQNKK